MPQPAVVRLGRVALAIMATVPTFALLLVLAGCEARQSVATGGAAALARNLAHASIVEIHVGEESAAEPLRRLAAFERARSGRDVRVLVAARGDPAAARIVVGTPMSVSVEDLAGRGGIALVRDTPCAFRVAGTDHDRPADLARATFEDPERPGLPVTLWIGNDLQLLIRQIEDVIPCATPALATWRGGTKAVAAELWPEGGVRAEAVERLDAQRPAAFATRAITGFRVEAETTLDPQSVERVLLELVAARERASAWSAAPWPDVAVRFSGFVEEYRLSGEHARLGRWNRTRPAAEMLVLAGGTDGGAAAVRAGLRGMLGPAVVPWIEEGASVSAARAWFGRDLDAWLARLVVSGRIPGTRELVDPASDARISAHVLVPLRAALFDHLRDTRGDEFVRGVWSGTRALTIDAELEAAFRAGLAARVEPLREEILRRGTERRAAVLSRAPELGAVFVEDSSDPRHGYGSRAAQQSLTDLATAGVGTVLLRADFVESVLPLGWPVPRALAPNAGDVALFANALEARGLGLTTLFCVNVLTSDAGTYSGAFSRDGAEAWKLLFERQTRAVEHAGYLANLADVDWLCVGTALRAISSSEPDGRRSIAAEADWKREGWSSVLTAARGAFPGAITYATADLFEAERAVFLADLDAIGIELAPRHEPGAPLPRADIAAKMAVALDGIGAIARRLEKPVLVTHASFAPIRGDSATVRGDWRDTSLLLFGDALLGARARGVDIRGAWVARVSTDSREPGFGARDSRFDARHLGPFHARFREAFRTGARSPR